jgi:hypothetical protein
LHKGRHELLMKSPLHGALTTLIEQDKLEEKAEREQAELVEKMSSTEKELAKAPHDPTAFAMRTAIRTAAHFSFVCVFSGVYPLAPALCYVSVLAGIHTEATMLLYRTRRPLPLAGSGANWHYTALVVAWLLSVALVVGVAAASDVSYATEEADLYEGYNADNADVSNATGPDSRDRNWAGNDNGDSDGDGHGDGDNGNDDNVVGDSGSGDASFNAESYVDIISHFTRRRHPFIKCLLLQYFLWVVGALVLWWDVTPTFVEVQRERQTFLNSRLGLHRGGDGAGAAPGHAGAQDAARWVQDSLCGEPVGGTGGDDGDQDDLNVTFVEA